MRFGVAELSGEVVILPRQRDGLGGQAVGKAAAGAGSLADREQDQQDADTGDKGPGLAPHDAAAANRCLDPARRRVRERDR